ncbi:MAG: cytochrome b/b6 domain-containing protein [Alphaproteobacteria bacterium]|nr:cytochrome b/b6 domain-containing protein [Alphaproteobacteria bacterium]
MAEVVARMVRIWDPFVRIGHWILVATFFIAYLTEDDLLGIHVWAGYVVGTIVVLRIIWGFFGPSYARFSNFVRGPKKVFSYLRDLILFRAPRYLGHSPAGGAMVIALLLSLAATVGTGLVAYGAEHHAGPLASYFASESASGATQPTVGAVDGLNEPGVRERAGETGDETFKEIHEFFANLTLVLIVLHIAGVGFASVVHRENLVRAMITGDKRVDNSTLH